MLVRRALKGEGSLSLTVFLRERGLLRIAARGAASGKVRFGGGTEPFVWGVFKYYRGRSGGLHLESVDVADDMLPLRKRPEALFMAVRWARRLLRHVPVELPADELLKVLYWSMRLLSNKDLPVELADWRFLYRWLKTQGLVPDLRKCALCGNLSERLAWSAEGLLCESCAPSAHETKPVFSATRLKFLEALARMDASTLEGLEKQEVLWEQRALFNQAARCLEGFLFEV